MSLEAATAPWGREGGLEHSVGESGPNAALLPSPPAHSSEHLAASSAALPAASREAAGGTGRAVPGMGTESTNHEY